MKHLSELRRKNGLSQEALAEKLGVSRQSVSKWENGEAMPELSKLLALCDIFHITPNDLLGYEQEAKPQPAAPTEKKKSYVAFWAVLGCMGFLVAGFCLAVAVMKPHIYNGIGGIRGSLLGNDCFELFWLGIIVMAYSMVQWYWELSGKGSLWQKIKAWLMSVAKLDEE